MALQPDSSHDSTSASPTAQHNLGLTHDSDQPHNSTTVQLDESGLSCRDAELLSDRDKSDTSGENLNAEQSIPSAAGASEQQPSSDTKPEVPKTGNAAQENEESIKGVAESSNNLQQTEGSSDQQQRQEQICPSGAGALKDEPPSDTKLEAANTGNADQETEKSGGAEPNNLQQTESSSDQQQQQDLSKSSRNPLCQLVSGSVFNSVSTSED